MKILDVSYRAVPAVLSSCSSAISSESIEAKRALIAPSIRQLQTICCDVGCNVNDLLSYCGPLSGW
ncbi:hypothetical protein ANCDUO_08419 [Ancylostoma duodenale]|uniref:Insulin-like domain-containing protein n=1 Tax=Ancylostoma duodenale TaxID=51022 RepID=A0A0C2CWJ5_9BILA|nr:hypothetical protein ANCDUO_08419 [Ancylostoma duodenale]